MLRDCLLPHGLFVLLIACLVFWICMVGLVISFVGVTGYGVYVWLFIYFGFGWFIITLSVIGLFTL